MEDNLKMRLAPFFSPIAGVELACISPPGPNDQRVSFSQRAFWKPRAACRLGHRDKATIRYTKE